MHVPILVYNKHKKDREHTREDVEWSKWRAWTEDKAVLVIQDRARSVRRCGSGTWKVSCLFVLWRGPSLILQGKLKKAFKYRKWAFPTSGPFEHALIVGPRAFWEAQLHDDARAEGALSYMRPRKLFRRRLPPTMPAQDARPLWFGGRGAWHRQFIHIQDSNVHNIICHNTYRRGGRGGEVRGGIVGCCCCGS